MIGKRVTIIKVAEEANVSVASVSRAFNRPESVTDATRERILRVADDLKYLPNNSARSLITRTTKTIGAILPDLYGSFFSEIIRGMDRAARTNGYHLLLSSSHNTREERKKVLWAMNGRVDGLLLMAPDLNVESLISQLPIHVSVQLINCASENKECGSVRVDNYGGAFLAVEHLIQYGHEVIGILKGVEGNFDAEERLEGYRSAFIKNELDVSSRLEVAGAFTETSGYEATKKLIDNVPSSRDGRQLLCEGRGHRDEAISVRTGRDSPDR